MKNLTRFIQSLALVVFLSSSLLAQNKPDGEVRPIQNVNLLSHPGVYTSGQYINYIRSYDVLKPGLSESSILLSEQSPINVLMTTQFMDGLGRNIQTVSRKASPDGLSDMVQTVNYDQFGRVAQSYLPYKAVGNDGVFRINPFAEQASFYANHYGGDEDVFYSLTEFESSPLNRVTKQMAPGNSWAGNGNGVSLDWRTNFDTDDVRIWSANGSGNPTTTAEYVPGDLMVDITIDEEDNEVRQFTDKLGRVILKQVQKGVTTNSGHSDWLNTYYVYNNRGNLKFVMPPKAVEILLAANWTWNATDMDALVFKYTYDGRNRMITKKVPGAGIVEMVYDKLDRLVATRDANMDAQNKWLFTKYDDLNRPVMTGFVTSTNSRAAMQTAANSSGVLNVSTEPLDTSNALEAHSISLSAHVSGTTVYRSKTDIEFLPGFDSNGEEFETEINTSIGSDYTFVQGYYDATFPSLKTYTFEVLSLSYFDNYDFTTQTYDLGYNDFYTVGGDVNAVIPSQYANVTGQATGSKVKVLGTADEWLTTVMFYDDRGRVIQTQGDNHVGGRDISTTQYDFSGKVLNTYTVHNNPNATPVQTTIAKRYIYDGSGTGRLLTVQEKLNNTGSHKIIATNTYNDLGELESKVLGNNLETLNYDYNIRGWLDGINKDYVVNGTGNHYFGMDLSYDYGFDFNQLNGNIAGVQWRSASHADRRAYGFEYDKVNRLTSADYSQGSGWSQTVNDFSTNYSYDANGNILTLQREGVVAGSIETIDNLQYDYGMGFGIDGKSNQLMAVKDLAGDLGQGDFKDGTNSGDDYAYDSNGNMTQDLNKDINGGDITYNHLNLPERIEFSDNVNKTITYTYDAAGIKLKKTVTNGAAITTTDYVSGFIYQNDELQHFANEEGRVRKNYQGNLVYDYFVKDHLGNTRMTLTEDIDVTMYRATMETDTKPDGTNLQTFEESTFLNLSNTRDNNFSTANTTGIDGITNDETARLNASEANRKIGPGKLLSVSAGDQLDVVVQSYHAGGYTGSYENTASVITTAAAAVFGGVSGGGTEQQAIYDLFTGLNTATTAVFVGSEGAASRPRAYLNVLILNQDFEYIDGAFEQTDQENGFMTLSISKSITQGGYVYVYLSNENDPTENFNVYFDDLDITHTKGAILQEDHYYPFGMNINALSSTAPLSKPNQFKYNGKELDTNFDLDWYHYGTRFYDPQLGRWHVIDALSDKMRRHSPYNYAFDNPIRYIDPDGNAPSGTNPIKLILKKLAKKGVKYTAKTSKGQLKPISRKQADKLLQNKGSVFKTTDGSTNKKAKSLMKKNANGKKVVRHDGHELPTGETGLPHYQKAAGDGSHVFYNFVGPIIPASTFLDVSESAEIEPVQGEDSESNNDSSDKEDKAFIIAADAIDLIDNTGTKIFGDNGFGRLLNELNPFNFGLSTFFNPIRDEKKKKQEEKKQEEKKQEEKKEEDK